MIFDVYRNLIDESMRIATVPNAGLPPHMEAKEWQIMKPRESPIIEDAADDIAARAFCFYKLVLMR